MVIYLPFSADSSRMYNFCHALMIVCIFEVVMGLKRNIVYWACQIIGWVAFILGNVMTAYVADQDLSSAINVSILVFIMGISITHVFRTTIHYLGWKKLNILALIPRVLIASVIMSFLFVLLNTALTDVINGDFPLIGSFFSKKFFLNVLQFWFLFFLWSILYFAVNVFENWKKEEIQNLELRAAKTEIELNSFRSQMNPHFMFNSLNSIRALIDEDPAKSKKAINMLSSIVRNNLMLGKNMTVTLKEELDLVENYLWMEKVRFEERLTIRMDVDEDALTCHIPPFMLQTIVENAVKHGISKIIEGGLVELIISLENEVVRIVVRNSGFFEMNKKGQGIGIANTRKRLDLIYGNKASFDIFNQDNFVVTQLNIPSKL
jgi:sensor histidine kinase YesM